MSYKRVLSIQDISCFGQCSLTVALPIISACGVETCVLPSAVLSTHTGGFTGFTFRDLTDDIPKIAEHWKKENISFDAVYSGYLGSIKQIDYVKAIMSDFTDIKIVDPAMADNGKLYVGFDDEFVAAMAKLCFSADIILPNITEACLITGSEYRENYDEAYINDLLNKLSAKGAKTVILTGVSYEPSTTGVLIYENGVSKYYKHKKYPRGCHGTGDIYASAFVGSLMAGKSTFDAAKIAADYTLACIDYSQGDDSHLYGAKFEPVLGKLIDMLK